MAVRIVREFCKSEDLSTDVRSRSLSSWSSTYTLCEVKEKKMRKWLCDETETGNPVSIKYFFFTLPCRLSGAIT